MKKPADAFNGSALPDLDLSVYGTESLKGFEQTLEKAISLLSRSPLARKTAEAAIAADYVIVVENAPENETPEQYRARERGHVDHAQKLIFLRKETDPFMLALTLVHELAHVSQRVSGGIRTDSLEDHPLALLKKLLAMEADARAQEMGFALEMYGTHPDLIDIAARKRGNRMVESLVDKIRPRLPHDLDKHVLDKGAVMAAAFKAFYGEHDNRMERENALFSFLEAQDEKTLQDPSHFIRGISDADLLERLDRGGTSYLLVRKDYIGLDGAFMCAISEKSLGHLAALEERRNKNPAVAAGERWQAPAYKTVRGQSRGGPPRP